MNRIIEMFNKKYGFAHLVVRRYAGQGSNVNTHDVGPYGLWPLNFDPPFDQIKKIKGVSNQPFLNLYDNLNNLSPFSLKSDQLENLTLVEKVIDLLLF